MARHDHDHRGRFQPGNQAAKGRRGRGRRERAKLEKLAAADARQAARQAEDALVVDESRLTGFEEPARPAPKGADWLARQRERAERLGIKPPRTLQQQAAAGEQLPAGVVLNPDTGEVSDFRRFLPAEAEPAAPKRRRIPWFERPGADQRHRD